VFFGEPGTFVKRYRREFDDVRWELELITEGKSGKSIDKIAEQYVESNNLPFEPASLLKKYTLQIVRSAIRTTSAQSGGGSINIQTINRIRIDESTVSASANGVTADSAGGNVSIDPELFTVRQSQIVARSSIQVFRRYRSSSQIVAPQMARRIEAI
jgi:hypothetical protein